MIYKAAIVIPVYKNELFWYEKISLDRATSVLGKYPIILAVPASFNVDISISHDTYRIARFPDKYFVNINSYNKLMLSNDFYEYFLEFDYILIYQLDAFVFFDRLKYFCNLQYDYIGAPWVCPNGFLAFEGRRYKLNVGNGGFSLRNIRKCINIIKKYKNIVDAWNHNEDEFFSFCGRIDKKNFWVAPAKVATDFSFEWPVKRLYKKNKFRIPFGCHAWMRFGRDEYLSIFKGLGVDLSAYANQMEYRDEKWDRMLLKKRLSARLMKMNSLMILLPNRSEWYICGFGKLGKNLAGELIRNGKKLKGIFDSNLGDSGKIWRNIPLKNVDTIEKFKGNIIVSSIKYESEIMDCLEKKGLKYGCDYVSLGREYAGRYPLIGYLKYLYED